MEHAGARGRDGHVICGRIVGQNHALRIPADKVEVGAHVVSRLALGAEYVGHREPVPGPSPRVGVDDDVATRSIQQVSRAATCGGNMVGERGHQEALHSFTP